MTLPSSGALSLSQITEEFGQLSTGNGKPDLNEYYRGGLLVTATSVNSSIPTSGSLSLSNFYGAAEFMRLDPVNASIGVAVTNLTGTLGSARMQFQTSGTITYITAAGSGGSIVVDGKDFWGTPTDFIPAGHLYEIRATLDNPTGMQTIGSNVTYQLLGETPTPPASGYQTAWYPMTALRSIFGTANNGDSTVEMYGTLEFRKIYSTLTTTSTAFSLYVESVNNV